jgi:hypothetical protein
MTIHFSSKEAIKKKKEVPRNDYKRTTVAGPIETHVKLYGDDDRNWLIADIVADASDSPPDSLFDARGELQYEVLQKCCLKNVNSILAYSLPKKCVSQERNW